MQNEVFDNFNTARNWKTTEDMPNIIYTIVILCAVVEEYVL